jgi:hypothetical protein
MTVYVELPEFEDVWVGLWDVRGDITNVQTERAEVVVRTFGPAAG